MSVTLLRGEQYRLDSFYKGVGYSLIRAGVNGWRKVTYVQGDDAADMRESLEATEAAHPDWTADMVLEHLWVNYGFGDWAEFEKLPA